MLPHFLRSELPDDELDNDEILGALPLLLVFVVAPTRLVNPRKLAIVSRRLRKEELGRTGEVASGTSSVVRGEESWRSSAVFLSHSWGVCSFVLLGESLKLRIDEAVLERLCVGEECFCRRRLSRRVSSGRATGETSVGGPFSISGVDAELLLLLPLKVDQRCLAAEERGRAPLGRWGLLERRSER